MLSVPGSYRLTPPPRIFVLVAAMLFMLSLAATPVSAAAIAVGGECTLAEAIANANNDNNGGGTGNGCAAGSGADTITLSADVALTELLPTIDSAITINGATFTISLSGAALYQGAILRSTPGSNLTLQNVTLRLGGGGSSSHGALVLGDDATISDVSFNLCYLTCVQGVASGATYSLSKVYFDYTFGAYYTPGAIQAQAGAFTINNVAFYQMSDGGDGLIGISSGASVTLTGCLYRYNVLPQLKSGSGTLTNTSSGTCTGATTQPCLFLSRLNTPMLVDLSKAGSIYPMKEMCRAQLRCRQIAI